jgi:acetylornithine deacetylase/succinyl-diaminopimelate desuccinylase-like protein
MIEAENLALKYARDNTDHFLEDLIALCAIPSISSIPEYTGEVHRAAEWIAEALRAAGLEQVRLIPTMGYPVVYGEWLHAGPTVPTILFYGHYDVQPALDLGAWESPPFEPQVRGENLVGRGASDMKGQTLAEVNAIAAWLRGAGSLPLNVKFLVEGEEEIGSRHLRKFIQSHAELLACDAALNGDAGMVTPELPAITYGLRGGLRVEVTVSGPSHDVHSGTFGGTLHNPAQALIELIAGMHDADGRVTLPGFYKRVRPLESDERAGLALLPMDEAFFLSQSGAPALWGEPEYTPLERTTARPTLEVLSFQAGLAGEGVLNIVPAQAKAALSMRLVPDQEPEESYQSLITYLETHAPPTVRWEARRLLNGGRASLLDRHNPLLLALDRALEETWGVRPAYIRIGGGIPVVAQLQEELGIPSILTGFGLPDDQIHGPNEKLHLPTWRRGTEAIIRFLLRASQA